jgi:hypothetical protein
MDGQYMDWALNGDVSNLMNGVYVFRFILFQKSFISPNEILRCLKRLITTRSSTLCRARFQNTCIRYFSFDEGLTVPSLANNPIGGSFVFGLLTAANSRPAFHVPASSI